MELLEESVGLQDAGQVAIGARYEEVVLAPGDAISFDALHLLPTTLDLGLAAYADGPDGMGAEGYTSTI